MLATISKDVMPFRDVVLLYKHPITKINVCSLLFYLVALVSLPVSLPLAIDGYPICINPNISNGDIQSDTFAGGPVYLYPKVVVKLHFGTLG